MAFVLSAVTLRSTFTPSRVQDASRCSLTLRAPLHMSLADDSLSGLKVILVTGAVALASTLATPSHANAALFHFRGERPKNIGLRYGRYLDNCPPTPNCVSSMANVYDSHYVPAWTYNAVVSQRKKTMPEAIKDVTKVLQEYPRVTIIKSEPTTSEVGDGYYIYAEFESKLMGFVDDVEFFFQPDNATVEYRSASRLGESDFDANRKRIRDIRVALQDTDKRWASVGYN